jgi:hypothetical protein
VTTARLAGAAGLAYVLGVSIENMEVLGSPTLDSPVADIREAYADHAFAVVTATAGVLALGAYAAFVAALYTLLREEPWRAILLVGGIGGPVVAAAGLSADAILIAGDPVSDGVAAALYDFYLRSRIVSGIFVALFLLGVGVAARRANALPRPLPEVAIALSVPMAVAPIAAFEPDHALEVAVTVAFAAQTLWIFAASMWLVLAREGQTALAFLRRGAFLLLVLAAGLIGIALVAVPAATGEFFSWDLAPEPLAAFAGGVYVGSAAAYAFALDRPAAEVRGLVAGAVVLSVSVLIITLSHTEQFDFDRLQAIMWLVLFAGFAAVTAFLLAVERAPDDGPPERLAGPTRALLGAVALAGGALALALWVDPTAFDGPIELPPLGGRFAGSWVALVAVVCGWAAIRDRADEARAAAPLLIGLPAGALIAGLRTFGELDPAGARAAYLAVLAALVLGGVAVARRSRVAHGRPGSGPDRRRQR